MRGLFNLAVASATAFLGLSVATPLPITVDPGSAGDIIMTSGNTLNGTKYPSKLANTASLQLSLQNNLGDNVNAYITGKDRNNALVILQTDGTYYYPNPSGSTAPLKVSAPVAIPLGSQGTTKQVTLPDYLTSGRIYFAVGTINFFTVLNDAGEIGLVQPAAENPRDPSAGVEWGFVEFTYNESGVWANLSFVDFVGPSFSMQLELAGGATQAVKGLQPGAVAKICDEMVAQAAQDGQPWDKMCVKSSAGKSLRVISPLKYRALNPDALGSYYNSYIDKVWQKYSGEDLTVDTQSAPGKVACRVNGNTLNCAGDNRGYQKPAIDDILGCNSGPFTVQPGDNAVHAAVVPRLCAAFYRSTLLLDGGNVQPHMPSSSYYTTNPTIQYGRIVHKYEIDGVGYTFAYDDVNPDGENAAGVLAGANPKLFSITAG
ncbi:glycoside hydrolase family 64 protein [Apiospora phragmitis]|uniref:Glycoside hydrolase family 64 protein n=1 Tax=Apiospora phragmitis TaxID=2905665 RepID=A0ABR1UUY4_9PEZI